VKTSNNRILDNDGRERYFHGSNVVVKRAPYVPEIEKFDASHSFSEEDMDLMVSMGMNAIRLGVPWAGGEPQDGHYNQTWFE